MATNFLDPIQAQLTELGSLGIRYGWRMTRSASAALDAGEPIN